MKRRNVILVLGPLAMATLVGCGGGGGAKRVATATTTTAPVAVAVTTPPTTTAPGATTVGTQAAIRISLLAEAGQIPPGRTAPVLASAWRVTGTGWSPGDVTVSIRRGTTQVLDVGATRVAAAGGFDQTFVMPTDAPAGTYTAVATQASRSARSDFTVKAPAKNIPVDEMLETGGGRQLWAVRQADGHLCSVLRVDGADAGRVCNEASEQDFNGDATLRYAVVSGDPVVVLGVTAPSAAKVKVELRSGGPVEHATAAASFTTSARFVMVTLPAGAVIRTISALDAGGRVLTTFNVNP